MLLSSAIKESGREDPIHDTLEDTAAAYGRVVEYLLNGIHTGQTWRLRDFFSFFPRGVKHILFYLLAKNFSKPS